jgi:predicted nucleotidyltransferase
MLSSLSDSKEQALRGYVNTLEGWFGSGLVEVLLFGSKARNEARTDSDLDVAVIVHEPSAQDLSEVRGLAFDILLTHGVLLSVRAMSQRGWEALGNMQSLFYRNVKRDSISLLSKVA